MNQTPTFFHRPEQHHQSRRGNALVLVAGILVLLVIIATAYFSRTNTEREIAQAQHDATVDRELAEQVGDFLATSIAEQLFVRPLPDNLDPDLIGANEPRLPLQSNAVRYGQDTNVDMNGDPYGFNLAPYAVIPWTNWPDTPTTPDPDIHFQTARLDDVPGGPGFGDNRLLASTEPYRMRMPNGFDVYTHWPKMTYVPTAWNGWRLVADISNVSSGTLLENLNIPYEQWLPIVPDQVDPDSGFSTPAGVADVVDRWIARFDSLASYEQSYEDPTQIPANLFDLKWLGPPEDEYSPGTARHTVSRFLTDADGDGFTDSFWFVPPWPSANGIRHVVGVRVVDNSAQVNVNTSTRFMRNDDDPLQGGVTVPLPGGSIGATPADVALIGQGADYNGSTSHENWNTGLLDNPLHHVNPVTWQQLPLPPDWPEYAFVGNNGVGMNIRHLILGSLPYLFDENENLSFVNAIGVTNPDVNVSFDNRFGEQYERMAYWHWSGSRPSSPLYGLTPFGMSDELELRAFHSSNFPWSISRLENAIQNTVLQTSNPQLLRGNIVRHEHNERKVTNGMTHQLTNPELVLDLRRHLTTHSGARNDIMPPWLWASATQPEQKFDLRTPLANRPDPAEFDTPAEYNAAVPAYLAEYEDLAVELRDLLQRAFADSDSDTSYYGPGSIDKSEEMAASMAANILTWRDPLAVPLSLEEAVPEDGTPGIGATWPRFIGVQRQPFLVEAFVAHVHGSRPIPVDGGPVIGPDGAEPPPDYWGPDDGFHHYVTYEPGNDPRQTTVVAVQIANPFDKPVDLREYSIRVAGTTIDLSTITEIQTDPWLHAATEEYPRTAVFYSIIENFDGHTDFGDRWRDFLDIDDDPTTGDLAPGSRAISVTGLGWSTDRDSFDSISTTRPPIELLRRVPETANLLSATYQDIVVDRFDGESDSRNPEDDAWTLAEALNDLGDSGQVPSGIPPLDEPDPDNDLLPGVRLEDEDDYYVSWARVTRAWGYDFNRNEAGVSYGDTAGINANERNPRFVFGQQLVTWSRNVNEGNLQGFRGDENDGSIPPGSEPYVGSGFNWANDQPDDPWFQHSYQTAPPPVPDTGDTPTIVVESRKPTFFNMHPVHLVGGDDIYPPFSGGSHDYGEYFYWNGNSHTEDPTNVPNPKRAGVPDKGFYGHGSADLRFPMQMLQKDDDFQQIGELNLVWRWGHRITDAGGNIETSLTFSERLIEDDELDSDVRVNRLDPHRSNSIIGDEEDPAGPRVPAAVRVLDAFVCDGEGVNPRDIDENGMLDPWEVDAARYRNAVSMSGRLTPGLININTAPIEVLRSLPHMYKLVDGRPVATGNPDGWVDHTIHPRVALPEAITTYRDLLIPGFIPGAPDYSDREDLVDDLRPHRGIESIGELQLLNRPGTQDEVDRINQPIFTDSWRIDFAGFLNGEDRYNHALGDPFAAGEVTNTRLSTNVNPVYFPGYSENPTTPMGDEFLPTRTGGDAMESNLLFNGLSNIITTRSDVFTVYFKVRSFRQRQSDLVWDATDRDQIVAERRYVMVVDRSEVNQPGDRPKILLLEELPN